MLTIRDCSHFESCILLETLRDELIKFFNIFVDGATHLKFWGLKERFEDKLLNPALGDFVLVLSVESSYIVDNLCPLAFCFSGIITVLM